MILLKANQSYCDMEYLSRYIYFVHLASFFFFPPIWNYSKNLSRKYQWIWQTKVYTGFCYWLLSDLQQITISLHASMSSSVKKEYCHLPCPEKHFEITRSVIYSHSYRVTARLCTDLTYTFKIALTLRCNHLPRNKFHPKRPKQHLYNPMLPTKWVNDLIPA